MRTADRLATHEAERLPCPEFLDPCDEAGIVRDIAIGHIVLDSRHIGVTAQQRVGQQAFQFGRENYTAVRNLRVMQRLDAKTVTHQPQRIGMAVKQGESEHAVEAIDAGLAPLAIAVKDDFSVAVGTEAMPLPFQFTAHLGKIVDFAVEGDGETFVRGEHRLCAAA